MSFQGPGTGISGTSNQFSVGYAGASSNAVYSGSSGNINGYAPSAGYANQYASTATNIQNAQGVNGTNWAWSGQNGTPNHLWGGNAASQYAVWQYGQMYIGSVGNATNSGSSNTSGNAYSLGYAARANINNVGNQATWNWIGQGGTPSWLWGSNDGNYNAVWQYGQMTAGNAGYAGYAGYAATAGYSNQAATGSYRTNFLIGGQDYNLGGNVGIAGYNIYFYNGMNTGSIFSFTVQGYMSAILNTKRTTGGNTADRWVVWLNATNNVSQYGYFNGGWGNTSDGREKEEITDLDTENALKFIQSLRPRKFKWRSDLIDDHQNGTADSDLRTGFIAQEVLSAALETKDESYMHIIGAAKEYLEKGGSLDITNLDYESNTIPTLGVSQEQIVSPLVKAVQALMNDIKILQTDVTNLESIWLV